VEDLGPYAFTGIGVRPQSAEFSPSGPLT
jgi:hypothetical protein